MALVLMTSLATTGPAWAGATTPKPTAASAVTAAPSVTARPALTAAPAPMAGAATPAATAKPGPASATLSPAGQQRITYGVLQFEVPSAWTVVDLSAHPGACVRFDVHVVYLGTPGAVQDCPSVVEGRTEAVLLQPTPSELPHGSITVIAGGVPKLTSSQILAGEVIAQVSDTGVLMTAAFGTAPSVAQDVFASLTLSAARPGAVAPLTKSAPQSLAPSALPAPLDRSFTWYYGNGFDACTAPALSTMATWWAYSPYRSLGIYIGGSLRGCAQANLTASWVRAVATMGWKAQPIYVGYQAPCTNFSAKITTGQEAAQGSAAASDAVVQAAALGIGTGSDIYYDMEYYPQSPGCSASVLKYLSAWTSTLQANGYSSGVYGSASSVIKDMANPTAMPGFVAPNKIWIANWNGKPNVYGQTAYVADNQWSPYARIHQYLGGTSADGTARYESYGGVQINIDDDYLDTDPNRGSPFGQLDSTSTGPSKVTANGWAIDPDTTSPIMVQMYVDGLANSLTWADQPRPDVGAAYPQAGPNHGYSVTMSTTPGRHTVCLYAINTGPGTSRQLSCRTLTVP